MCGKARFPSSPKALMGSLNKMNFIRRFSALCLRRKSKMQQRHQSSRRPAVPLGSRILTDPSKVFEHNMWDHMQWSQEEEEQAKEKAAENSLVKVQLEDQEQYEREASKYWNEFYKTHRNNFFKDRNWLFLEFPEILPEKMRQRLKTQERSSEHTKINITNSFSHKNGMKEREKYWKKSYGDDSTFAQGYVYNKKQSKSVADNPQGKNCEEELGRLESFPGSGATYRILEVGCGAGNSVFPILKVICNTPGTFLYCCDFASGAVELVKSHSSYNSAWCSAFVHDVCDDALPYPFPDEILDVILLVFVLSTIHPDRMQGVINRLAKLLKPGGMLLFRDYGRYDTAQLRFKKGRCLSENFYVRGDGTRVYFFTKDEIWNMFNLAGLTEVQNLVDRRLQVNRKKKVKMQRVWVQSKFQKPLLLSVNNSEETTKKHPYG